MRTSPLVRKCAQLYLLAMAIFLVIGNLPRVLSLPTAFGSANLSELLLFFAALFYFSHLLISRLIVWKNGFASTIIIVTLISLFIGVIKWGAEASAILYNIRFVMLLFASLGAGYALFSVYHINALSVIKYFILIYSIALILAIIVYILFPESTVLWARLEDAGIEFKGDPHVGRLVSLYLDPNYFGTIIVLPIILIFSFRASLFVIALFIFFIFGLALTASRSGLSSAFIFFVLYFINFLFRIIKKKSIRIKSIKNIISIIIIFIFALSAFSDYLLKLSDRFTSVSDDSSANARLESFKIGNELISREPLLGFGYNYVLKESNNVRGIALDSSAQTIVASFGILMSFILMTAFLLWATNMKRAIKKTNNKIMNELWFVTLAYFVVCILWAGNFNQLFFYPFWIVPVTILFSYIELVRHDARKRLITLGNEQ